MIPEQICYVELLFTIIDRKILPKSMTDQMYDKTCDVDMKVYLTWLLNRWVILRNNDSHYQNKNYHQKLVIKKKYVLMFRIIYQRLISALISSYICFFLVPFNPVTADAPSVSKCLTLDSS